MGKPPSVALISDDLMFASQLQAAMRRAGGSCSLVVGDVVPPVDAVFVDLNSRVEERLALITALRQRKPDLSIAGFCHHGERAVRRRALAAGATRVVNNGALQEVALRLDGRLP
jgi:DNA-binding NarL/FixJ family response regulator